MKVKVFSLNSKFFISRGHHSINLVVCGAYKHFFFLEQIMSFGFGIECIHFNLTRKRNPRISICIIFNEK